MCPSTWGFQGSFFCLVETVGTPFTVYKFTSLSFSFPIFLLFFSKYQFSFWVRVSHWCCDFPSSLLNFSPTELEFLSVSVFLLQVCLPFLTPLLCLFVFHPFHSFHFSSWESWFLGYVAFRIRFLVFVCSNLFIYWFGFPFRFYWGIFLVSRLLLWTQTPLPIKKEKKTQCSRNHIKLNKIQKYAETN